MSTNPRPMTPGEAAAKCATRCPQSSVCVTVDFWSEPAGSDGKRQRRMRFSVSLVPGLDGKACSRGEGLTLAQAVDALLGGPTAPTPPAEAEQLVEDELEQARRLPGGE